MNIIQSNHSFPICIRTGQVSYNQCCHNDCCICRKRCLPKVITGSAVNILDNSATIMNSVFSGITGTINTVGVQYSTDPAMVSKATSYGTVNLPFSVNLTGLLPDTTYYYRAVVHATSGSFQGAMKSFTTPQVAPTPIVITGDAVNILENSATIMNNTFSGIIEPINAVGVQYSTSPAMSPATTVNGIEASPFSVNLTGLQASTTYYYHAVVTTTNGVYDGAIKSFTTPQAVQNPVVITGDAVNVLQNSATISNNTYSGIAGTINSVGVQYSTSPAMTIPTTVNGTVASPFSVNLTSLLASTTYYYRAVINATSGLHYGEIKSFTTPQAL